MARRGVALLVAMAAISLACACSGPPSAAPPQSSASSASTARTTGGVSEPPPLTGVSAARLAADLSSGDPTRFASAVQLPPGDDPSYAGGFAGLDLTMSAGSFTSGGDGTGRTRGVSSCIFPGHLPCRVTVAPICPS